jgi:acetyl esterase/lipase
VRPTRRAAAGGLLLTAILVTGLVHSPFVHAASLPTTGPRAHPDLSYGARPNQKLDLTLPDPARFLGRRPLIVWLHAGGWEYGSRKDPAPLPQYEVSRGYAMASVEYGLSPQYHFPTPVYDVKLAIRWLKAHATQYNLDPSHVVVAGYSAGAQLAALVALTPNRLEPSSIPTALQRYDDSVVGTLDISGGYDLLALTHSENLWAREAAAALVGCAPTPLPLPLRCPPGVAAAATVRNYVGREAPPIYIVWGSYDPLFIPSQQVTPLVAAWEKARLNKQVDVQAVNAGHGIDLDQLNLPRINQFLDDLAPSRHLITIP